jgi:hypothetical protein
MKLVLVGDDGEMLDFLHVADDEFSYAQEDGDAATLIMGNFLPMRYDDAGKVNVYVGMERGPVLKWTDNVNPPDLMTPEQVGQIKIGE